MNRYFHHESDELCSLGYELYKNCQIERYPASKVLDDLCRKYDVTFSRNSTSKEKLRDKISKYKSSGAGLEDLAYEILYEFKKQSAWGLI